MSSRRDRINKAFDRQESQTPDNSLLAVDSIMFSGSGLELETQRHVVKPIAISHIFPDPTQPRRAMPSEILKFWRGSQGDVNTVFAAWLEAVKQGNKDFDLDEYLQPPDDADHDESGEPKKVTNPVEQSFLELVSLAVSIRRDGLTNPITVAKAGDGLYQIETGERRWLAYHLLHLYFDGGDGRPDERKKWDKIPARIVEQSSVWRQATENTARQDLNAIGRARQFAVLLMDLLRQENQTFEPLDALVTPDGCDRPFYAQVGRMRPPRGKASLLMNAMGAGSPAAFTRCRDLLSLPDYVWTVGDDFSLPEDTLLELAKLPPEQAISETQNIARNFSSRKLSENPNIPTPSQKPPPPPRTVLPKVENPLLNRADITKINKAARFLSRVGRSEISQMDESQQKEILDFAKHLERIAHDIKDTVKGS